MYQHSNLDVNAKQGGTDSSQVLGLRRNTEVGQWRVQYYDALSDVCEGVPHRRRLEDMGGSHLCVGVD